MKTLISTLFLVMIFIAFKTDEQQTITGYVYAQSDKNPIHGALVYAKSNNSLKTHTDKNGFFKFTVSKLQKSIMISSLGFLTKEVKISNSILKIYLENDSQQLEEVAIVGKIAGLNSQKSKGYSTQMITIQGFNGNAGMVAMDYNTESYNAINENGFKNTASDPLSTFSADVDAASYSNMRRFIKKGQLPPKDAVRVEEMINYFGYDYPEPKNNEPIAVITDVSDAPWNKNHRLVRIGIKAKSINNDQLPASNLVFLIDVSGSMQGPDRLELLKTSMKLLTDQLRPNDKVAIVVYAGAAGLVLPSTPGNQKIKIKEALNNLSAGGSTAGGAGIKLAYETAKNSFIKGGNNRIILATDGDFNIGASSDGEMQRLIESYRNEGIFLSVLGFGSQNLKDSKMETLADKGNGNYAYIDEINEAKKVLINEFGATLFTVAKDVKIQVEFNPAKVIAYRLVGYENRLLNNEDFKDDQKDGGEMGAGHTVTALYEVIPFGMKDEFVREVTDLKYQKNQGFKISDELLTVKIRYKNPDENISKEISVPLADRKQTIENTSLDFKFVVAVAEFGLLLRDSEFKQNASFENAIALAKAGKGKDEHGYRSEFIQIVENAMLLSRKDLTSKIDD